MFFQHVILILVQKIMLKVSQSCGSLGLPPSHRHLTGVNAALSPTLPSPLTVAQTGFSTLP